MHSRIKEIFEKIKYNHQGTEHLDTLLKDLHGLNTTRTEASIVLFQGYGLDREKADELIINSGLWESEDYLETMYQVAKYLKKDFESPR